MKDAIYRISLDIHEHGSQAVLKAKKTDTGRMLHIILREGGTPYIIEADCYAVFKATKPDGSILYNACTIENNEIIYEFTEQTCTAVGRCRCEIALYGLDDKLITSPRFALLVDGTIYPEGSVESTDEFSALAQLISGTLEATEAATQAARNAEDAKIRADATTAEAIRVTNKMNDCAVLVSAQDLDKTKQKQARDNIGAVGQGENIDLSGKRIFNSNGILFYNSGKILPMDDRGFSFQDGFGYNVILTGIANGIKANDAVNKQQLDAAATIIVTVENGTTSHITTSIYNHIKNGGSAYLLEDGVYLPLAVASSSNYAYAYYVSTDGFIDLYEIFGNEITRNRIEYATKQQIGDIETALDSIIAIQNELIGGDAQ